MWIGGGEQMSEKFLRGVWERLVEVPVLLSRSLRLSCKYFVDFFFFLIEVWAWLLPCPCGILECWCWRTQGAGTSVREPSEDTEGPPRRAGDSRDMFYIIISFDWPEMLDCYHCSKTTKIWNENVVEINCIKPSSTTSSIDIFRCYSILCFSAWQLKNSALCCRGGHHDLLSI